MIFFEKPMEVLLSLLVIGIGAWVPTIAELDNNTLIKVIATLTAVVGGAVLSNTFKSENKIRHEEKEKWKQHYFERIKPINRHLGSLAKEIFSTISKVENNKITEQEALRLISQMTPNLIGAMTDLGEVIDSQFDPSSLYETTQQIGELLKLLNSIELTGDSVQQELVEEVKAKITQIHPDVYIKKQENINCPNCFQSNEVHIGKIPPASQVVECLSCKKTFHAHRAKDLTVTASKAGSTIAPPKKITIVDVKCVCGATFSAKVKGDEEKRSCQQCHVKLVILKNGEVKYP